jgi:hypothetical protein
MRRRHWTRRGQVRSAAPEPANGESERGAEPAGSVFDLYEDVDLNGDDIGREPQLGVDLGSCKAACRDNGQCRAFTFNERTGAYFLKSGTGLRMPFEGAISGLPQ